MDPHLETTTLHVSTISDSWIQISYSLLDGERNRALSIIKSRGSKHSNQLRELIFSDSGITLADPYTAGGEVLMGTLRLEKENSMRDGINHIEEHSNASMRDAASPGFPRFRKRGKDL
jgi:circadian clock protein KaiC